MNLIQKCSSTLTNVIPSFATEKSIEFQHAIYKNNAVALITLAKATPQLLTQILPNGELPLNYAIRQSQSESIKILLELGVDPTQNDDQGFNAVTTAYIKEDHVTLSEIFNQYLSKDLAVSTELKNDPMLLTKANQILAATKKTSDSVKSKKLVSSQLFIHFNHVSSQQKLSFINTIILNQENTILEEFLQIPHIKDFLNEQDSNGLTPLHYAAALGRLDLMKTLLKHGAKPEVIDKGISCFALLAAKIHQQNPFHITKYDSLVFVCSLALWTSQLLSSNAINPRILQGLSIVQHLPMFLNPRCMGLIVPFLLFDTSSLNTIFTGFSAIQAGALALKTFNGIRSCWRNASLNYGQALLKAVVSYTPKIAISYATLKSAGEYFNLLSSKTPITDLTTRDIKCLLTNDKMACLKNSETMFYTSGYPYRKAEIEIENLFKVKSPEENCDDAAYILSGESTTLFPMLKKEFYKLSQRLHPDAGGTNKEMTDLNNIFATIKNCWSTKTNRP